MLLANPALVTEADLRRFRQVAHPRAACIHSRSGDGRVNDRPKTQPDRDGAEHHRYDDE